MTDRRNGWADATIAGFRALGGSRYAEAAARWLSARALLEDTDAHDPRRLAGEANAGLAHAFHGHGRAADDALVAAEQGWMKLSSHVATADIPVRAGSSSFQFKLAAKNLTTFQDLHRKRAAGLCEAALAITRFNRLVLSTGIGAGDAVVSPLSSLLSDILGPHAPEVRLLQVTEGSTDDVVSPYADKAAALEARFARTAAASSMDIWLNLEAAVSLTALLHPGLLGGNPARCDPFEAPPARRVAASSRKQ